MDEWRDIQTRGKGRTCSTKISLQNDNNYEYDAIETQAIVEGRINFRHLLLPSPLLLFSSHSCLCICSSFVCLCIRLPVAFKNGKIVLKIVKLNLTKSFLLFSRREARDFVVLFTTTLEVAVRPCKISKDLSSGNIIVAQR